MSSSGSGHPQSQSLTRIEGYCSPALANALNGLTGAEFQVSVSADRELANPEEPVVWRQPFSVADGAMLWLVAGKDLWEAIGRMVMGGAGIDSVTDGDCRSTWNEVSAQTMGGMAQAMSAEFGREVAVQGGGEDEVQPTGQNEEAIFEVSDSLQFWKIRILWNAEFARGCSVSSPQQFEPVPVMARETVTSKTLELLLDVALPVSVSFGKTMLEIREILKLNTGSVVELDRLITEPVEVIVNNCVIARGEVVVVDGNYGVRVIHLASRDDRLRSGMSEATSRLGMAAR